MRILVCGGRDFTDYKYVLDTLDRLSLDWPKLEEDEYGNWLPDVTIISGGARGVDSMAIDWAVTNWCSFEKYPAKWYQYGKLAGYLRNIEMLEKGKPDLVVAFAGGKGTQMMVRLAKVAKIPVIEA